MLTYLVRHLSLADKIIVLGSDGRIAEQGTFESLRSQNGFVSKLLLHPELLESTSSEANAGRESNSKQATTIPKALRGPSDNDVADLTRRIGDISVYKYYLRSIGSRIVLIGVASSFVWMLCQAFPRKYPLLLGRESY